MSFPFHTFNSEKVSAPLYPLEEKVLKLFWSKKIPSIPASPFKKKK